MFTVCESNVSGSVKLPLSVMLPFSVIAGALTPCFNVLGAVGGVSSPSDAGDGNRCSRTCNCGRKCRRRGAARRREPPMRPLILVNDLQASCNERHQLKFSIAKLP